jgi:hypothetical protein
VELQGRWVSSPTNHTLSHAKRENARVIPYGKMLHTQSSRRPFVIVRVAFGIEKFKDRRNWGYGHHDQMRETISMDTDEKLAVRQRSMRKKEKSEG